jgi:hypothetical protein
MIVGTPSMTLITPSAAVMLTLVLARPTGVRHETHIVAVTSSRVLIL